MPVHLIAEIALRRTLKHGTSAIFSYRVPPRLHGIVAPGQLVWVPLKSQQVQGVVLRLVEQPEYTTGKVRDIADIADPEAVIPPTGLRLADWLASTYRAPLYEALALLLPPGTAQDSAITWRATTAGMHADLGMLPEAERAVLYYLRKHGQTAETDLRNVLHSSETKLRDTCMLLHSHGLLERDIAISAPRVRPRTERVVRLLCAPDTVATTLKELQRAPKQQAVVRWLAEHTPATASHWFAVGEVYAATGTDLALLRALEQKGVVELEQREVWRSPLRQAISLVEQEDMPPPLTPAQRQVWNTISHALDTLSDDDPASTHADEPREQAQRSRVFLLHGVTGSGKTEIYLRAVARALRMGRQALVLVPEIALTTQLVRRFALRFPGKVAVMHSSLSPGERYDEWRRVRRGDATVVIGSRSAVFAPLARPGVLIVDEEHEPGYKSDHALRYHARDVVLRLAELSGSVVLLGSATPGVESYYAASSGRFTLLELKERVGASIEHGMPRTRVLPLPHVLLVDMRRELQSDNRSIFSRPLQTALGEALERGEQAILFLNRRGAAMFVMCRDCGTVVTCPTCGASLVLHYEDDTPRGTGTETRSEKAAILLCHSCSYRGTVPPFCPTCLSTRIKSFGVGTQRVEQEVVSLFPQARPLRWDRDSVGSKDAHTRLFDQFLRHEADVLVGTQMIAKGLDLPHVSVVGVVAADTALYMPDFRSGERTFQLLTQVAGRAGRRKAGAQVIIQTYTPEHYALQAAQEHDYHGFYTQEISFRRQTLYPPFSRLIRFVYASSSQAACERASHELAATLDNLAKQLHLYNWGIIGPAPASLHRLRGRWRWHVLLRLSDDDARQDGFLAHLFARLGDMRGWTIDVDPVHVL
jgi:primosomal protein N' (replication factor Y)